MLDSLELSESASSSELFVMDDAPISNRVSVHLTRAALRPELELLTEVIEPKNAIASQQNLLLEAFTSSARIRLRAVGRLNTLQCDILADVQRTGTLCLPARRLAEIVRHLFAIWPTINSRSLSKVNRRRSNPARATASSTRQMQ